MPSEEDAVSEILLQLKLLSNNIVMSENIHEELGLLRADNNDKISDLKGNLKEMRMDIKELHNQYDKMNITLVEFKKEMEPIIEFKQRIQQQIIKYSALAFLGLFATTLGLNQLGIS